jgi:hypothetical protein
VNSGKIFDRARVPDGRRQGLPQRDASGVLEDHPPEVPHGPASRQDRQEVQQVCLAGKAKRPVLLEHQRPVKVCQGLKLFGLWASTQGSGFLKKTGPTYQDSEYNGHEI